MTYVETFWCHNVTWKSGCFPDPERGDFSRNSGILRCRKMGLKSRQTIPPTIPTPTRDSREAVCWKIQADSHNCPDRYRQYKYQLQMAVAASPSATCSHLFLCGYMTPTPSREDRTGDDRHSYIPTRPFSRSQRAFSQDPSWQALRPH